jgi:hypothetical protein
MGEISIAEVKAGDVLLFRGRGLIPWAIRLFDGGDVNHAAIALDGPDLAEAAGSGLRRHPLADATAANVFTEVRRMDVVDTTPILTKANAFVEDGNKYAYHQLVLLALLAVTRRVPAPRFARRLIRSALDHAATALGDLVPTGKTRMICSEFVWRCYAEAAPPSPIEIELATVFAALDPGDAGETVLEWALRQDDREVELAASPMFAASFDLTKAEADIEEAILEYADLAGLSGTLPEDIAPNVSFAAPPAPQPEPSDDDLLASMALFGTALKDTAVDADPGEVTFGVDLAALGAVALKGALQGILDVSVDGNFVTPRDLAKSKLAAVGRLTT